MIRKVFSLVFLTLWASWLLSSPPRFEISQWGISVIIFYVKFGSLNFEAIRRFPMLCSFHYSTRVRVIISVVGPRWKWNQKSYKQRSYIRSQNWSCRFQDMFVFFDSAYASVCFIMLWKLHVGYNCESCIYAVAEEQTNFTVLMHSHIILWLL